MSKVLDYGRGVLADQPFSVLLGTKLTRFETGLTELYLDLKPEHLQHHGFAHGGLISYLCDTALAFAGGSALGNVLTQEIKVNFTRPGKGEALIARAHVVSSGKTQAVCRCDVFVVSQGKEKLCAAAQGTIVTVPK